MTYTIELAKEAGTDLAALHKADRRIFNRILSKIESLSEKPFEGKPLVGNHKGEYALRVGKYRIVYELHSANHIGCILTAKHLKHVY